MATGPKTSGRFHAGLVWQPLAAASVSAPSLSAESELPQSTWPALKFFTPAPEPDGL